MMMTTTTKESEREKRKERKEKLFKKIIFSISIQSYLININHNQWIKSIACRVLLRFSSSSSSSSHRIVVDISISFSFALSWLTSSICVCMCVCACVYTHHLSCWEWNDDDNKSHVTFAYRVPQLSCFCPIISLCKMLVNNLRLVAICSSTLERCMQPNVHDREGERERFFYSICARIYS